MILIFHKINKPKPSLWYVKGGYLLLRGGGKKHKNEDYA